MPIKIRRITIRNYKGIDKLSVDFPPPRMSGDPDILVIGSENGLGKTSILECCALLLLEIDFDISRHGLSFRKLYPTINIPDLFIRADSPEMKIKGDVVVDGESAVVEIEMDYEKVANTFSAVNYRGFSRDDSVNPSQVISDALEAICGVTPNPAINSSFLFFHSYRKIQEGSTELGKMLEQNHSGIPLSAFKLRILHSLMGKAGLFESEKEQDSDDAVKKLDELIGIYAGGTISKLRYSSDSSVDIRIMPATGGESFTLDGLSSGQKEIISTLFLIWHHTRNNPSVVLIDEPELHLNAQWHRTFIRSLVTMAPQNQYIMATHSEDIMDSVDRDRRILLLNSPERNK